MRRAKGKHTQTNRNSHANTNRTSAAVTGDEVRRTINTKTSWWIMDIRDLNQFSAFHASGDGGRGGAHWRWSIFNSSVVYVLHVCECTVFVCVPCVSPVKGINPEQYIWYAHRGFYKGDNRRQNPRRCIYNSLITLTAFIFTIFIAYL